MAVRLNASCPLVVLKVEGAIRLLPPLQAAHPVQAAIVALAIEYLLERQVAGTFVFDSPAIWASKEEKPILLGRDPRR